MKSIPARLAVLIAAFAAVMVPVATPATAAPTTPTVITCWNEFDTVKIGQTIYVSAIKDCTNLDVPQNLTLTLEAQVCGEDGLCTWVSWLKGTGVISYTCPGSFYAPFRNSRMREKLVYCSYF